jgi:hypothetical protein
MKDVLFAVYYKSMSSVISALKTNYNMGFFCEKINNLSLSFVSPLRSYDSHCSHELSNSFPALFCIFVVIPFKNPGILIKGTSRVRIEQKSAVCHNFYYSA